MSKLTGNTRFRITWRGKLVLQVEYSKEHSVYDGWEYDTWTANHWRDAKVSDYTSIDLPVIYAVTKSPNP